MSEPQKKQDFLELAKHQFAQITAEFEKALEALKDPDRRRQLTSSYLDLLQKGLSRAQDSVAKYQDKIAAQKTPEPPATEPTPGTPTPGTTTPGTTTPGPPAAEPPATGTPESGSARPPEPPA